MISKIIVKDKEITIVQINEDDYISLADIAKIRNDDDTNMVIASWIRRVDTIGFLKLWELINNENF
ncbi:MAG: KilA-N domain-containing protein [Bacilli bacterium]|nr:KilA-N domain-containing protein [Bacilli bacterium]